MLSSTQKGLQLRENLNVAELEAIKVLINSAIRMRG